MNLFMGNVHVMSQGCLINMMKFSHLFFVCLNLRHNIAAPLLRGCVDHLIQ